MNQTNYSLYKRIILVAVIIAVIVISIFFYYMFSIEKKYESSFDQSKEKVIEETELVNISDMYAYQEKELFHIFFGNNKSDVDLISVVHLEKDKEISAGNIKTVDSSNLLSEEAMLDSWAQTCNQCELVNIQAAYSDENLLWEIKYNDVDNRYVFDYYFMTDGKQYEELKFKRNFN